MLGEAIRDMASNAFNQIGATQEERSMRWKCNACWYSKHFTKAVPLEAAGQMPSLQKDGVYSYSVRNFLIVQSA
jgi:hypothetical protein